MVCVNALNDLKNSRDKCRTNVLTGISRQTFRFDNVCELRNSSANIEIHDSKFWHVDSEFTLKMEYWYKAPSLNMHEIEFEYIIRLEFEIYSR